MTWLLGQERANTTQKSGLLLALIGVLYMAFLKGRYIGIGMVVGVMLVLGIVTYFVWIGSRTKIDIIQRHYLLFCSRLAAKGFARKTYEGPIDFSTRIIRKHPEWASTIETITKQYIALRYSDKNHANKLNQFKNQVRAFRP